MALIGSSLTNHIPATELVGGILVVELRKMYRKILKNLEGLEFTLEEREVEVTEITMEFNVPILVSQLKYRIYNALFDDITDTLMRRQAAIYLASVAIDSAAVAHDSIKIFDHTTAYDYTLVGVLSPDEYINFEMILSMMNDVEVEKLKKVRFDSGDCSCSICLEHFLEGMEVVCLSCQHVFHECCIVTWLDKKNTCPLCRCSIAAC